MKWVKKMKCSGKRAARHGIAARPPRWRIFSAQRSMLDSCHFRVTGRMSGILPASTEPGGRGEAESGRDSAANPDYQLERMQMRADGLHDV